MAREAQFTFVEESAIKRSLKARKVVDHTATVNAKTGMMSLSLAYIRDTGLEGKFVKFYADPSKRAIGWQVMTADNLQSMKGHRKINVFRSVTKKGSQVAQCIVSVKTLMKVFPSTEKKSYKKIPIHKYTNMSIYGDIIHYVELK